ncbi:DinI family protein [bacterium]|nr:DinI family protein [bacterium]
MNTMNAVPANATMNFETFVSEIKRRLQERYTDCEVTVVRAVKNNNLHLTGIAIQEDRSRPTPTIYLENFYEEYRDGSSMETVFDTVCRMYWTAMPSHDVELPDFRNFNSIKDSICCRIINRESNREHLKDIPHRPFLDLAVAYSLTVTVNERYDGQIVVTNQMMARWQADEETLFRHAMANMPKLFETCLTTLVEIIRREKPDFDDDDTPIIPLYILRYEYTWGAAALLDRPLLQKFACEHGDFYILPSSTHEVLLLPVSESFNDHDTLSAMVRNVNQTKLEPDEVLSDHAYLYHAYTNTIEILE